MKDERKTEIKVGIMTLAGIVIFLWILGWAKGFTFRSTENEILVRFPEVAGLEIGDYVTVNGVRKGNVKEISVQGESVLVKLEINKEVELREDAVFAVMMLDLMGGKKIEVKPGNSAGEMDYSAVQKGEFYADIPSVMSLLGSVQDDLLASIKDIRITLTSLNKYLTDEELNNDVRNSMRNLNTALTKLNALIDRNRADIETITKNTAEITKSAKTFLSENQNEMSETIQNMNKVMVSTDSLLTVLNTIANETTSQKNNLGKILYDEELFKKIETTLNQLNELTGLMNEQLKSNGLKVDADINLF
jgi:phospholipid/cholesterol/gamma-HCH transport system substrate-binding protein